MYLHVLLWTEGSGELSSSLYIFNIMSLDKRSIVIVAGIDILHWRDKTCPCT